MKQLETDKDGSHSRISPLLEHILFGGGTLLSAIGPVVAGLDMVTWMAIFMGINAVALVILCLLGAWSSVTGSRTASRRRR